MKSKRENLLSSSSSWRENPHPSRKNTNSSSAAADRCLPGFFHLLFSTFHFPSSGRKSLTLGSKKREQKAAVSASPAEANNDGSRSDASTVTLPNSHARPQPAGETARLSLVGALEKCDRDLAELQKTIDVIKATFLLHQKLSTPPAAAPENFKFSKSVTGDVVRDQTHSQKKKTTAEEMDTDTDTMVKRAGKSKPNTNVNIVKLNCNVCRNNTYNYNNTNNIIAKRSPSTCGGERRVSRSMVESVNQVCDDVAWGEQREVGMIGVALQDHICRDLIEETVRELSSSSSPSSPLCFLVGRHRRRASGSLPLDACRRRLIF